MGCRVYAAVAMTGRSGAEILADTGVAWDALWARGLTPVSPAVEEGVRPTADIIASGGNLPAFWKRDKELIQSCHVLLDLSGPLKSAGVEHEVGYMRYCLWRPVVRIWAGVKMSIATLEDDAVVGSAEEAAALIAERWGTRRKRILWRLRMLRRCLVKWLSHQAGGWR